MPGWLDPLLPTSPTSASALVAPRVASAPGAGPVAAYEQGHSPLDLGPEPGRIAPGTRLSYVPAAALLVRADALRAIDGFDRSLRFGEDVDAVWRLVEAGWRCRYEPASVVHHRPRGSWRALVAQRVSYGSSAAPLAQRHPGALGPGAHQRVERRRVGLAGRRPAARRPLAVAGGTALRPRAQAARRARRPTRCASPGSATSTPAGCWPTPAGGRGGRSSLAGALVLPRVRRVAALAAVPALLGGGLPRLVDDLAYGVGLWKGVARRARAGPAAAALHVLAGAPPSA